MKIVRVYNNNVVLTYTDDHHEAIAVGAGVGFQMKPGLNLDESKIEKMFYIHKQDGKQDLYRLLDRIPAECFEITQKILDLANIHSAISIDDNLIIVLADHISFAVKRALQNEFSPNLVLNEIKALYNAEYLMGKQALEIIQEYTGILLPDDEAGYIAMHIINAKVNDKQTLPTKIVYFTKDIIDIAKATLGVALNEDSLDYYRLTTHLKFLANKILSNTKSEIDMDEDNYALFILMKKTKANLMPCVDEITSYIHDNYNYEVNASEKLYLLIHVSRLYNPR